MPQPYTFTYSPLTYIGSKRAIKSKPGEEKMPPTNPIFNRLQDFFETHSGYEYREPFFGGGSVGLNFIGRGDETGTRTKDNPIGHDGFNAPVSVWLNDFDPGTAAYWNAVLKEPEALIAKINANLLPTDRKKREPLDNPAAKLMFDNARNELKTVYDKHRKKSLNPSTMPAKAMVHLGFLKSATMMWSFGARGVTYAPKAVRKRAVHDPANSSLFPRIRAAHATLSSVRLHQDCITCLDYSEVVDAPGKSFVYCDPPYTMADDDKGNYYSFTFKKEKHRDLVWRLKQRKNWMLSYDFSAAAMQYCGITCTPDDKKLRLEICDTKTSLNATGNRVKEEILFHDDVKADSE